ncbi:MAG TPA: helix-turn-helix transcriptional regulator [Nostocaceae cyanobacterium]|nr:helix-turn-helix transcriptional regulator [Nostocaceae cyanobacterium]
MNIPQAIKILRKFHDMTQQDLANKVGITKSHVSETESGKKNPSMATIQGYAHEFGVQPSEIVLLAEAIENPNNIDSVISVFPHPKIQAMLELKNNFQ